LGFLHRKALEGKIEAGQVVIAEEAKGERGKAKDPESDSFAFGLSPLASQADSGPSVPPCLRDCAPSPSAATSERGKAKEPESDSFAFGLSPLASPLGYLIASDRYLKRDELGVIYQLCVVPGERRKLVAGALLKAQFDRSAYGCRLYCCWCAQDLQANH